VYIEYSYVVCTFCLDSNQKDRIKFCDSKPLANTNALLAIGFAFWINVILGGNVSGASMNPARSFGRVPFVVRSTRKCLHTVSRC